MASTHKSKYWLYFLPLTMWVVFLGYCYLNSPGSLIILNEFLYNCVWQGIESDNPTYNCSQEPGGESHHIYCFQTVLPGAPGFHETKHRSSGRVVHALNH